MLQLISLLIEGSLLSLISLNLILNGIEGFSEIKEGFILRGEIINFILQLGNFGNFQSLRSFIILKNLIVTSQFLNILLTTIKLTLNFLQRSLNIQEEIQTVSAFQILSFKFSYFFIQIQILHSKGLNFLSILTISLKIVLLNWCSFSLTNLKLRIALFNLSLRISLSSVQLILMSL